ncbi:MAG: glycosyltransferase family 1 protein [bacterium]|nr:glycosyltransferase family 1 protein [bacterium]
MVQLTPLVAPGAKRPWLRALNERMVVAQIRRVLATLPPAPVQVWTFAPDVAFLAGQFDEQRLVYYCVDEYSGFEDFDGQAIASAEQRLIDRADVVITTSDALHRSKRRLHPDAHLVRHGVDAEHFSAAVDQELPLPAALENIPRPIFGFFGLIHHWIDVALLAAVARIRTGDSFVFLGDCPADVTPLRELPNVHLLGRKPYRDLPAYCRAFDAALLPFRINDMTRNINPIKLREYLAAGLPVISTPLPEALPYRPDVLIADDADTFAHQCGVALTMNESTARRRRSQRVAGESWEHVVQRLAGIVQPVG